ncbi:hypothetical protein E2986_12598 [Frieseomelitta varia]|uniref:Transmembrane protein n=1 Tax=Frieseomelitta varia TaxID=561572 RepID=A0A833VTX3_9HYME|nr:hypothetical protein E2986_12598 [Frieseomelitta varia]
MNIQNNYEINSYINNYFNLNQFRLLETNNQLIMPFKISLQLIVSSLDILKLMLFLVELIKFMFNSTMIIFRSMFGNLWN